MLNAIYSMFHRYDYNCSTFENITGIDLIEKQSCFVMSVMGDLEDLNFLFPFDIISNIDQIYMSSYNGMYYSRLFGNNPTNGSINYKSIKLKLKFNK